ncbi:MAG: hypothetical protein KDD41_01175 [Flavobacteriales bacterium]|nr:hypothetical protein [Flavobacteriales bacterium]
MKKLLMLLSAAVLIISCSKKDDPTPNNSTNNPTPAQPKLIFKLYFDSTLTRLDNFGNPATIPAGNSAQSPRFNHMSAHYIEFAQDSLTQLGNGFIAYHGQETTAGGANAVDFDQAVIKQHGETFYSLPLSSVAPGTYKWLRVSLTYQNYDIDFKAAGSMYTGTLASFVGFNNYITNYTINTQNVTVNANKLQGYWGFETIIFSVPYVYEGQTAGTTVPNPIASTSPVPAGSCVVTGDFPTALTITGNETSDIIVNINLSTNKSFEWKDLNMDGIYEPSDGVNPGDTVVDMGLRGLFPTWQ